MTRASGERPVALAQLQGAWHRERRSLSAQPWGEVADVWWLQVGRHFCDLRTPYAQGNPTDQLDAAQAFSGSVRVHDGLITFHHDLDSIERAAHSPQGTVRLADGVLLECGPGFEERWILTSSPADDAGIAELRPSCAGSEQPLARLVRIGAQALAVWGGPESGGARFSARSTGGWVRHRGSGDRAGESAFGATEPMALLEAVTALGSGGPLPDGWIAVVPEEV